MFHGEWSITALLLLSFGLENVVKIINVGGGAIEGESCVAVMPDSGFQGGNVLRTNESIHEGGDFVTLYQSARIGNFCYQFDGLPEGYYSVDFNFAEIININGPEGMRVFDVFVQEEKASILLNIMSLYSMTYRKIIRIL